MEIIVLGTGSADSWPNPWCACISCTWARSEKILREPTCIVVNRSLLIDCGPATAGQAERAGITLTDIDTVLITHAHFDHLAPQHLLTRSWTHTAKPLRIIGPPSVIDAIEHWIGPNDPVTCRPVTAGDTFDLDGELRGTTVRVLPSTHFDGSDALGADAVLFDVSTSDGGRLLYATDTGPLSEAFIDAVRDASFDIAFVEETFGLFTDHGTGHLDLTSFPIALDQLREVGAVTPKTAVVAVHLSHHNPPGDVLSDTLAQWGAHIVPDGTHLSFPSATPLSSSATQPPASTPPRRILVTGGARSGKSHRAEALLADAPQVRYLATGGSRPDDPEWAARVATHQARRPATWVTVETLDLVKELSMDDSRPILIDCLSLWLAGTMDRHDIWETAADSADRQHALAAIEVDIAALVESVRHVRCDTIMVTNEVGSGVVPDHESGRLFRDLLGRLNAHVATSCDQVELVVAGRVITL